MYEFRKKKGISLIILVITLVVIVILAATVLLVIINNNLIENANKAAFQSSIKTIQEEFEILKSKKYVDSQGIGYDEIKLIDINSAITYIGKLEIKNGKLGYYTNKLSRNEKEWAKQLGLEEFGSILDNEVKGVKIDEKGVLTTNWYANGNVPDNLGSEVIIPDEIISIGAAAFRNFKTLVSIEIPKSVKSIQQGAFNNCINLKNVELSNNIVTISNYAFYNCQALEKIEIPNSVNFIGVAVFANCKELTVIISKKTAINCFGETPTEESVAKALGCGKVEFKEE